MSKKLITTSGTEFEQNMAPFAIIDDKNRAGKPLMLDAATLEEAFENASSDDRAAFKAILDFDLEGEEISVTPTTSQQIKTPSKGKNAITKATIGAVTADIDSNIVAGNIKNGVTILGVEGTYIKPEDANLIPGNIKKGVTIYGVEGTYEGEVTSGGDS